MNRIEREGVIAAFMRSFKEMRDDLKKTAHRRNESANKSTGVDGRAGVDSLSATGLRGAELSPVGVGRAAVLGRNDAATGC